MGKNDILELFYRGNELLSPMTIVIVLASAVVCGLLIFAVYYFTTDKSVYSRTFNNGNVLMVVITSVMCSSARAYRPIPARARATPSPAMRPRAQRPCPRGI